MKFLKSDPNRKHRGAGHYYHRGSGIYSKKDDKRDRGYRAKGFHGDKNKVGSGLYRHTHDSTSAKAKAMGTIRPRRTARLNPGHTYYCARCRKHHTTKSNVGKGHARFKAGRR